MLDELKGHKIPGYAVYRPHQHHAGSGCITNIGMPFPCIWKFRNLMVVDVIHGVAYLAERGGYTSYFWNPTACKYITLDRKYSYDDGQWYFGFGFGAAKSDFKVVVLLSNTPYYDIYSVQDGFWRRFSLPGDIYQGYAPLARDCFLNGTIYWMAVSMTNGEIFSMLSFDCEHDEFKIMELPQELSKIMRLRVIRLFKFGDKLSLLRWGESFEPPLKFWVMDQDVANNNNTWNKLCNNDDFFTSANLSSHDVLVAQDVANNNTWNKLCNIDDFFTSANLSSHDVLVAQDGSIFVARRDELSSVDTPFNSGTLHQPLNGFVFRESLFLMDVKSKSSSHNRRQYMIHNRNFVSGSICWYLVMFSR